VTVYTSCVDVVLVAVGVADEVAEAALKSHLL